MINFLRTFWWDTNFRKKRTYLLFLLCYLIDEKKRIQNIAVRLQKWKQNYLKKYGLRYLHSKSICKFFNDWPEPFTSLFRFNYQKTLENLYIIDFYVIRIWFESKKVHRTNWSHEKLSLLKIAISAEYSYKKIVKQFYHWDGFVTAVSN